MFAAIDAGGRDTTAWATSRGATGHNLEELATHIRRALVASRVVLAIEAPLWVPIRSKQHEMTSARTGERFSWAGRVGGGALAAGLANLAVVLRNAKPVRVVFDETSEPGHLVVLEAYRLSAGANHAEVADDVVKALANRWPDKFVNCITRSPNEPVLNLVAAMALGLSIPISIGDLSRETKVIDPSRLG